MRVTAQWETRLVSLTNTREHWAKRAARAKAQRSAAAYALRSAAQGQTFSKRARYIVTITRIGKRALDSDNLQGACKSIRDGVADALGIDDGDPRIEWRYAQERGDYAVRVQVEGKP
jgi:hypothetical protein